MVLAESGEDDVIYCSHCDYAANIEKAESSINLENLNEEMSELVKVSTPNKQSIEEVAEFLNLPMDKTVKAMVFKVDGNYVIALIRGDYEINDVKLKNILRASDIELASNEEIEKIGLVKGFIGGVGIKNIKIVADLTVKNMKNYVTGANEADYHFINTNHEKDYEINDFADIRTVKVGEKCPRCKDGELKIARGIEVGQVFKLGKKYSSAMNCVYLDENGKSCEMVMGCYGIGVSRTMAATIEQNYDENGIIWPMSIAPYHVDVIPANVKDNEQMKTADIIYQKLLEEGVEVVIDDRDERAGFKFKDADLIGFPIKIIAGKGVTNGKVEMVCRKTGEKEELNIDEVVDRVKKLIKESC